MMKSKKRIVKSKRREKKVVQFRKDGLIGLILVICRLGDHVNPRRGRILYEKVRKPRSRTRLLGVW